MDIDTGNLISKTVVRSMLRHIPKSDLKGLSKIRIMLRPPRSERSRYGFGDYHFDTKVARVFLWSIKQSVVKSMIHDNNYYHVFLKEIASTLYHEIGHHVHYHQGNGKELSKKHDILQKKVDNPSINGEQSSRLHSKMWFIHSEMENFANDYMDKFIVNYNPSRPAFRNIRFIKIFRERLVNCQMNNLRQSSQFSFHIMAVIEHLRKCKLSKKPLYSITEICEKLNTSFWSHRSLKQKYRRKIKQECLKIAKPIYYVSKSKRRFAYYSKVQFDRLVKHTSLIEITDSFKSLGEKADKVERLQRELHWAKQELAEAF